MVGGDRRSPPRHKAKGGGGRGKGGCGNGELCSGVDTSRNSDFTKSCTREEIFRFGGATPLTSVDGKISAEVGAQIVEKSSNLHKDSVGLYVNLGEKAPVQNLLQETDGFQDGIPCGTSGVATGCNNELQSVQGTRSWALEVEAQEDLERVMNSKHGVAKIIADFEQGSALQCMDGSACSVDARSLCKSRIIDGSPLTMKESDDCMQVETQCTAANGNHGHGTGMECDGLMLTAAISQGVVCNSLDYVNHNVGGCKIENSGKNGSADSTGMHRTNSCTQAVCSVASTGQHAVNAVKSYVKTAFMGEGTSAVCGIAASNGQETALNMQNTQVKKDWNSPMVPSWTECATEIGNVGFKSKITAASNLPNTHPPNAWKRTGHLKINTMELGTVTNDGRSVSFDETAYERNKRRLENGLVGKLFGRKLPLHILDQELSRRWSHVGGFRTILIGGDCFLCVFESMEARDSILMGGPWQIMGQLIGMEKWSPECNPELLTGFSSPVWVRFPKLPLLYWDNITIARIASMIGEPLWIDAQTIEWGRCEYARVCIRIDLSKSLPTGVWIQGKQAEFFQAVEYEGISLLCFHCGA